MKKVYIGSVLETTDNPFNVPMVCHKSDMKENRVEGNYLEGEKP